MSERSTIDVIKFGGELDVGRKDELRGALVLAPGARGVLLDLSEVTYADSTALSLVLKFGTDAEREGVPVAVVATSPQFVRLIRYAGLEEVFPLYVDRGAALNALKGPPR